jgi:hypothetical protein
MDQKVEHESAWAEFEIEQDEYIIGVKGNMTKYAFKELYFVLKKLLANKESIAEQPK